MPYSRPRHAYAAPSKSFVHRCIEQVPGVAIVRDEWSSIQEYASSIAVWTLKFWAMIFVGVAWMLGLMCSAAITYLLFYNWMIPSHHTTLPVHFDFSSPLASPHATVHLQGDQQWRYTEGNPNTDAVAEQSRSRYFEAGHQYSAFLDLTFPDSVDNSECGVITVEMLVLSRSTLLATSLQSFLPQYTSPLVRWLWTWTWAPALVTGLVQEKQSLTMHMFDQLVEHESSPISEMRVLLKSPNAHRFQIYSATLRLQVQLYGLRYLMYSWPISTAFLLTSAIFSVQLFWSAVLLLVACLMLCGEHHAAHEHDEDEWSPAPKADAVEGRDHFHAPPPPHAPHDHEQWRQEQNFFPREAYKLDEYDVHSPNAEGSGNTSDSGGDLRQAQRDLQRPTAASAVYPRIPHQRHDAAHSSDSFGSSSSSVVSELSSTVAHEGASAASVSADIDAPDEEEFERLDAFDPSAPLAEAEDLLAPSSAAEVPATVGAAAPGALRQRTPRVQ